MMPWKMADSTTLDGANQANHNDFGIIVNCNV